MAQQDARHVETERLLQTGASSRNGRIVSYQLPGDAPTFSLQLSTEQPTFAELRQHLQKREAPPNFYIALQEPGTGRWFQEADFESGVIPLWEPLTIKVLAKQEKPAADVELTTGHNIWGIFCSAISH